MESAFVLHPVLTGGHTVTPPPSSSLIQRSAEQALEEAVGLVAAIGLNVVEAKTITVNKPRPATLLGTGKLDEISAELDSFEPRPMVMIVNGSLTPVQHRNLEKVLNVKVLDRTALILEIFGERARTSEGRLQVDLAHLTYQRSRLVRSWTHLERQRGGAGFLGGPGERQIESDRRVLADKIVRLRRKLEEVRRTRNLQRAQRKRAPQPVVALVGYTNAGKSTLFNRLTEAEVQAEDLLFATLDPTMRAVDLPSGQRVIFSDTVGFISDLPTQLVAAFRATLEEVLEADLIVHVRDISHVDSGAQRTDVLNVLAEIGVSGTGGTKEAIEPNQNAEMKPFLEALNKIDLLNKDDQIAMFATARQTQDRTYSFADAPIRVAISAVTGEGLEPLFDLIDRFLTADRALYRVCVPVQNGAARAFLHRHGDVDTETTEEEGVVIHVRLSAKVAGQFGSEYGYPMADVKLNYRNNYSIISE